MSTTLEPKTEQYPELIKLRRQDSAIAELAEKYLPLTIAGIDDKAGYAAVHEARMVCVKTRTGIEKVRKDLKADALEYGRRVDSEAKRITELLAPIEEHLTAQQKAIDDAKAEIARKAELAKQEVARHRVEKLAAFGWPLNPTLAMHMTDDDFRHEYDAAKHAYEAEQKRKADEAAAKLKAEQEAAEQRRIEDEARAAKDAELKAREAELARIEAEQKAESERLAAERLGAEMEKARQEAAEKARIAERERSRKEADDKRIAAEKAEAERLKREAERPYREKLIAFARSVDNLPIPEGNPFITKRIQTALSVCYADIAGIVIEELGTE